MIRSLGLLFGGSAAFWLVMVYPAFRLWGQSAIVYSAVAGALCLVPTAATLAWARAAFQGPSEQLMVAVMGGTAVRMVAVFGGGLILYYLDRYFSHASFWICVVVFYLFTLTLEMVILVGRHASPRQLPKP